MDDVKPDRIGRAVSDAEAPRLATLYGLDLAEIEHEAADEMASALNRRIHSASLKRPNP
jgi:hypothetical protein